MKLVRKRKNGTLRSLPYLAPGTTQRKEAEAVGEKQVVISVVEGKLP